MMSRRNFIASSAVGSVLSVSGNPLGQAVASGSSSVKTGYAPVNGLRLYYEIHGAEKAEPLVLLHGGLGSTETLGELVSALAKTRRVIAADLQGHGRTGDIDRPLTCEAMADDIAALLKHLNTERADVM